MRNKMNGYKGEGLLVEIFHEKWCGNRGYVCRMEHTEVGCEWFRISKVWELPCTFQI